MSQLYHDKCKGIIYAALPLMLQVVTFTMSDSHLSPAGTSLRFPTGRLESGVQQVKFFCSKCAEEVDVTKHAYILCPACDKTHTLDKAVGSAYTPFVGEECFALYLKAAGLASNTKRFNLLVAFDSKNLYV